jgi:hypothetical protein
MIKETLMEKGFDYNLDTKVFSKNKLQFTEDFLFTIVDDFGLEIVDRLCWLADNDFGFLVDNKTKEMFVANGTAINNFVRFANSDFEHSKKEYEGVQKTDVH